ncbi:unnamed protein product, partial [Mesorhabditis spiculigera]
MSLALTAAILNIVGSGLIIIADVVILVLCFLYHRRFSEVATEKKFQAARDAAQYAQNPALLIYLIGKQVGLTEEEMLSEYERDYGERKLIVQSVMGREESVCNYFLKQYMSRFVQYGYAEEGIIITALREMIAAKPPEAKKPEEKKEEDKQKKTTEDRRTEMTQEKTTEDNKKKTTEEKKTVDDKNDKDDKKTK